jgi:hypothetical protein
MQICGGEQRPPAAPVCRGWRAYSFTGQRPLREEDDLVPHPRIAFPGVSFDGGVGVLCRAARQKPSSRPL